MQLEEIGEPQHVLHQVNVLALLLSVAACPEHLVGVYEVEHYSEGSCGRPEGQQDADLLSVVDAVDDVSELL